MIIMININNDYLLAPHKIKKMSDYQLKRAEFYNIPIGNVEKL